MPFGQPDTFEIKPKNPWAVKPIGQKKPFQYFDTKLEVKEETLPAEEPWKSDLNLKTNYGVELAKQADKSPFDVALNLFQGDANKSLWASHNWIADPTVVAARQGFVETVKQQSKLLDKDALAAKLLAFADEKHPNNPLYPLNEAKDRLAALKLYSEVMGFTGPKVAIDASTNNVTNNEMKIILVEAENKQQESKTIENLEESVENVSDDNSLDIKLKLVG